MSCRLNGWKTKSLSLASRVRLAKTALATILNYIMQTMKIPNNVCAKIDMICRQFIWGSSNVKRKIHLINWNLEAQTRGVRGSVLKQNSTYSNNKCRTTHAK